MRNGYNFTVTWCGSLYNLVDIICLSAYWVDGERHKQRTNPGKEDRQEQTFLKYPTSYWG